MTTNLRLQIRTGHPDFLDLPWDRPLASWDHDRMVRMARGPSRHVVRFVAYDDAVYACKEIDADLAEHEFRALRAMTVEGLPVVEAVGVVTGRTSANGEPLGAMLITRYLDYSLPYTYLFGHFGGPDLRSRLLDAGALLLVRLHLVGVFWGDCSLANVLFRRDAGGLIAYLVDAETVEIRPTLADGMRRHDLEIATENLSGGLADLVAADRLSPDIDPAEIAEDLLARYEALWAELTRVDVVSLDERHLVEQRIRSLNEIGFDVEELVVDAADGCLHIRPVVVEEGHHCRELARRTGLRVQENQARRLLGDIAAYRAHLERDGDVAVPESVAAARWLTEVYEPLVARVPDGLRGRLEPPELFHELLEHRWSLAEASGREVGNHEALASLLDRVLPGRPEERTLLGGGGSEGDGGGDVGGGDGSGDENVGVGGA